MREFSIPAQVDVADCANLTEVVFARAAREPDAVVIRRRSGDGAWTDLTAGAFAADVAATAKGLIAAGIQAGDRVALMCHTRYEWTVADYAIWAAGAVTVPIYETSSPEQVRWILGDSGARAAFVEDAAMAAVVESVRTDGLEHVWRVDDRPAGGDVTDEAFQERRAAPKSGDLATIVYTSGTTGSPKGCELTHGNLVATAQNAIRGSLQEIFHLSGGSTLLFLPLAHVFARLIEVGCVESGVVLGHSPDVTNIVADLGTFRPTFLLAVPRVFEKVYNGAEQKAAADGKEKIFHAAADTAIAYSRALDAGGPGLGLRIKHAVFDRLVYVKLRAAVGGQVQFAVSGGAALGERLGHFFRGVGITILEGYGLTETTAPVSVNTPTMMRIGSVGRPMPGTTVRIADDGEILVKGSNVFVGYWHNPEAGSEALNDGWFHTGDLGELDDDGFLRITGRAKEIIVTAAGKNVAPAPLEDLLRAHPLISQAMVIGDGRRFISCLITLDPEALESWKDKHGKNGLSMVELADDPDIKADVDAAVADANASVSHAEAIKKYVILGVDFTQESGHLTPSLKVKRSVVMKDFADRIEEIYA